MLVAITAACAAAASPQDASILGRHAPIPPTETPVALGSTSVTATAVLNNVPGNPGSMVPGLTGVVFEPGLGTSTFDRVYGHPNGHWILTALADLPTGEDECLLVDGALAIREGDPAPWTMGTENCGTIDTRCAVNGNGDFVFATNSSASSLDDYVARFANGAWTYAAREGDPVPGLAGVTLDDAIDSPLILDDGRVGYAADGVDGSVTTDTDDVLVLGGVVVMQEGVTIPAGQASSAAEAIENFDLSDFWASADGTRWLVQGDLGGATSRDDVVIVDGSVVLQEGQVVPGSGYLEPIDSAGIFGASMDVAGHWFARGDNDMTNDDWVVRDGLVVARTGAPVHAGAAESWDDSRVTDGFFGHTGNASGDFVVGGMTDHVDPALDGVIVMNGESVVVRESDPVDLDGDGMFDDGVFVDTFGDDDLFLTDDLRLYVVCTLKDAMGTRVGQALVRFDLDPGIATMYCDATPNSFGQPGTLVAMGTPSVAMNDLRLVARDLPPAVATLFLVGRDRAFVPGPAGSQGNLCVDAPFDRFLGPGEFGSSDASGSATLTVDLGAIPQLGGAVAGVPGEAWCFQTWYRDQAGGAATTNFTNAVEVVLE